MPSTGDRRPPSGLQMLITRRRLLVGLAAVPVAATLAGCTGDAGPEPSGSSSTDGTPTTTPATQAPLPDGPALEAAAAAALALLAAYEATTARHPPLGPVLAPFAADHDAHLEALSAWITAPTATPAPSPSTSASGPSPSGSAGPPVTSPPVSEDPAAARAAIVAAEEQTGDAAREAARSAEDGEAARLLASIGASRGVHALLLGAPA